MSVADHYMPKLLSKLFYAPEDHREALLGFMMGVHLHGCLAAGCRLRQHFDHEIATIAGFPDGGAGQADGEGQEALRHVLEGPREFLTLHRIIQVGPRKHLLGCGGIHVPVYTQIYVHPERGIGPLILIG